MTKKYKAKGLLRGADIAPTSFSETDNTIEVVFSSEAPVRMYHWDIGSFNEILSHEEGHVRLGRFAAGASALDNHNAYGGVRNILGATLEPRIESRQGVTKIKLSEREELKGIVGDIKAGIIKNVSVGYRVHKYVEITLPDDEVRTLKAVDWEPYEVSFVTVPADPNAQSRSENETFEFEIVKEEGNVSGKTLGQNTRSQSETTIPEGTQNGNAKPAEGAEAAATTVNENSEDNSEEENARCLEIVQTCQRHNLPNGFVTELIKSKQPIAEVRALIINKIAEGKRGMEIQGANIVMGASEGEKKREAAELAIRSRLGHKVELEDQARNFRALSLDQLARELDPNLRYMSRWEVAQRSMHTNSDFSLIFANIGRTTLSQAFSRSPRTFTEWCRPGKFQDFKEKTQIKIGNAPELKKIAEGGEYTYGTVDLNGEKYQLSKYGRIISFTEEMFMNDDIGLLERMITAFGSSSCRLESKLVYSILTGTHLMSDGKQLFCADHGNLGTPGAPSEASFDEMFSKFGEQKEGDEVMNLVPKFVIGGHKSRLAIEKLLVSITAGKASDVNVFQNSLIPIIDGNISDKNWFGACSPNDVDTIEYSYLEGTEGPELTLIENPKKDSIDLKLRHFFATKALDHKGLFANRWS